MDKFSGMIGFAVCEEDPNRPSIWVDTITERPYRGDILRNDRRWNQPDNSNGNLTITSQFSIICDPYLKENMYSMRYLVWRGIKWSVTHIDEKFPRLILTVGGEYHGDKAES